MVETESGLTNEEKNKALQKLRATFEPHQIGKLPKPTKQQTDEVKKDFKKGIRCDICGQWHHPKVIHLDYVGHAALTDRLLDVDPQWDWQPMALDPITGLPLMSNDGMWILLTVCGISRLGFGDAQGKTGPNAIKEMIGDALRNAAMRFGVALDLWHKGDLHPPEDEPEDEEPPSKQNKFEAKDPINDKKKSAYWESIADKNCSTISALKEWYHENSAELNTMSESEIKTINSYVSQLKDSIKEPPPGISCPKNSNMVTKEDCKHSKCSSTFDKCKSGSKLKINI